MKKRIMAMLMTAILVIASVPFTAFAEEMPAEVLGGEVMEAVAAEAAEAEAVPAAAGEEAEAAEETAEAAETLLAGTVAISTWKGLQDIIDNAPGSFETPATEATTITLTQNLTAEDSDSALLIGRGKKIILDLNGKTLNRGLAEKEAKADGSVIIIDKKASLTLKDGAAGGKVTGGNTTGKGGGINVIAHGNFTMEGGTISGNKSQKDGSGVFFDTSTGEFHMTGGAITGNTSYDNAIGAGVTFGGAIGGSGTGKMFVGGDAKIKDNVKVKDSVETKANVYVVNKITIETGTNKPKEGMSIGYSGGILPETQGTAKQFTENASEDDLQYFIPDDPKFKAVYNSSGYLELQWPHMYITADKNSYNIGDDINLTIHTMFVTDRTEVTVTEGAGNNWTKTLSDGTASLSVKAAAAGTFTYKASIEAPKLEAEKLEAEKQVTVSGAPKKYFTVSFSTNGGTPVPEDQRVIENGKADRPEINPAKDGYEFAGWYADAGCTNPYDFNMPIDRGITIFAKWTKKPGPNPDPKPDPTPSSDDTSEPLFTGTWGNPVKNGRWTQDANGIWSYTSTETFRNTWGYIANPFAKEGQHQADWFYFDQYGHMLTGWQWILWKGELKCFDLNPTKDGTLGACLLGPGKTPDGYEIDASGAWTGK